MATVQPGTPCKNSVLTSDNILLNSKLATRFVVFIICCCPKLYSSFEMDIGNIVQAFQLLSFSA
ncbi:hypothetical protein YC2023_094959 [Brassica napus]